MESEGETLVSANQRYIHDIYIYVCIFERCNFFERLCPARTLLTLWKRE